MPFVAPACPPAQSQWLGRSVALAAGMMICACVRQAPVLPPILSETQDCGAERLSNLKGQHFSVLAGADLSGALRVLYPMQAMTMDFSPTRLNARVNEAGIIRALTCG